MVKGEYHDEKICKINKSTEAEINEAFIIGAGSVRQQINCSLPELLKQRNELLEVLKVCSKSLRTYGRHPLIEKQVEQIINKIKGE